jgi:septation ring formation regulator EzrA
VTGAWQAIIGLIGSFVTISIFLIGVVFRMGRSEARIDHLEEWRANVRMDMHEISDQIQEVGHKLTALVTMFEERTERRQNPRQ